MHEQKKKECESKMLFVDKFVKPMMIAMGIGATNVIYHYDIEEAHGWISESVTIYFTEGSKTVNVNYDSKKAIVSDIINALG